MKYKNLTIRYDDGKADTKDIETFEKKYNICFPKSYKELMLEHNGARLEEDNFSFVDNNDERNTREFLFKSFGIYKYNLDDPGEPIEDAQFVSNPDYYGVPGLIGIGSTAEGDTLCFDYRDDPKTCEPKVVLLVHDEYEQDENGNDHMKIENIADSFDAFLDMLYEYKDDEEYN